jgi:hypothetical protein
MGFSVDFLTKLENLIFLSGHRRSSLDVKKNLLPIGSIWQKNLSSLSRPEVGQIGIFLSVLYNTVYCIHTRVDQWPDLKR